MTALLFKLGFAAIGFLGVNALLMATGYNDVITELLKFIPNLKDIVFGIREIFFSVADIIPDPFGTLLTTFISVYVIVALMKVVLSAK